MLGPDPPPDAEDKPTVRPDQADGAAPDQPPSQPTPAESASTPTVHLDQPASHPTVRLDAPSPAPPAHPTVTFDSTTAHAPAAPPDPGALPGAPPVPATIAWPDVRARRRTAALRRWLRFALIVVIVVAVVVVIRIVRG